MRAVLLVVASMSAVYGTQVVIDMLRPRLEGEDAHALVGWLNPPLPGSPYSSFEWYKVSFWCYVVSLPVAVTICLIGRRRAHTRSEPAARDGATRTWQASAAGVLLLPYPVWLLDTLTAEFLFVLLLCLPSTAYALWLVHRMQRFARLPVWLLLATAGWGAVIGSGFGGSMNQWWMDYANSFFAPDLRHLSLATLAHSLAQSKAQVSAGAFVIAAVSEEIGKAAGVAIVYLLMRRHIDNVVSGIVLGAASGIGFNLMESAMYMQQHNGADLSTQYFLRQSLGLLGAHMAFTAAIGAGFGIARQIQDPRRRRLAIVCGFAVGMAGHFANDVFITAINKDKQGWFSPSHATDMLVLTPLSIVVLQGPLVLLYLVLLRRGLRDQAAALAVELRAETVTGSGAVTVAEAAVLLRPARRFHLRLRALRSGGIGAYRSLGRLHAAQLRLGMTRWHRSRDELEPSAPDEQALREQILGLKHHRGEAILPSQTIRVAA
ncbi:PrsW family intramembrane metalloprotease [Kitasatospora kifunensis]|uniref:RsiW-degrading membrane proteinase PrsW (M82 family) n=1 Tax=Kitasatospora kifunensis TaxID=58351 RepID=A0A7W7VYZ5_KITKI|nr:PrsW family intramembrane metalloprotease [Kitasatospora kifunensis]MBB4928036.1 RsiW-degrading membrane proteinase PrsW (M82 family) [Kitasatospora kifunensis]